MERLANVFTFNVVPFVVLMLPLFGFTVLSLLDGLFKRDREENRAGLLACGLVLLAFAGAVFTAFELPESAEQARAELQEQRRAFREQGIDLPRPEPPPLRREPTLGLPFVEVGDLRVDIQLLIDPLTVVMMLVITGIGSLIHIYSLGYMAEDPERVRYFSYLNLFTFFMLLLVMGGSLPLLFVGWEGVGLCSYFLIGFWFKKTSAADAGKKAFIVNRVGDAGLIIGMAVTFYAFGTLDLSLIVDSAGNVPVETLGTFGVATAIGLLLFVGACGKSAQIPLHVWLPDAMEGPTPVSALIHAATMVTAGVYLVARMGPVYMRSETAMMVIAVVGTLTAIMAATVALVQTDIKRVLAYSTVSQLGFMFLACGVGAFGVAVFHLFTHAFFKALLFLGSGSVIHALSGEQDLRKMGGLSRKIPWTFWTFLAGTLAIAGIFPFAGFFSKDAILAAAYESHQPVLFGVALFTALLTAFYMSRLLILAFFGRYRGTVEHEHGHEHEKDEHEHGHGGIHESPASMLIPLVLLALGSIGVGFIHIPDLVAHATREAHAGAHPAWLPYLATLTALAGIVLAWYLYVVYPEVPRRIGERFAAVRRVLEAKWGFDDLFNAVARRGVVEGSTRVLWQGVDVSMIDRAVNGTAAQAGALAQASRALQSGLVRGYVLLILGGAVSLLAYLLWLPR